MRSLNADEEKGMWRTMILLQNIVMRLVLVFQLAFMLLAAKYIYGENCYAGKKQTAVFLALFLAAECSTLCFPQEAGESFMVLLLFLFFSVIIAVRRKKRRIQGFFLVIPVMGIVSSIEMIPQMLVFLFAKDSVTEISGSIWFWMTELAYNLIIFLLILTWIKRKAVLIDYVPSVWERRVLNGNGFLLLAIYLIAVSLPQTLQPWEKLALAGGVLLAVMIMVSSVILVMQGRYSSYYRLQAEVNEQSLKTQLDYFKAYQETQEETRRIKHDMRNHMLCAKDLLKQGKYEELEEYLSDLSRSIQCLSKDDHIGNDIANAIISEKYQTAKKLGVEFVIEGSMAGIETIKPLDVCTIFANALDNAMEAVTRAQMTGAVISINVKRRGSFLLLTFINPCGADVSVREKPLETVKKDAVNHGFGIVNMRRAAEKYKGSLKYQMEQKEDGESVFCLEIMLML